MRLKLMIHAVAIITVLATSTVGFADDLTGIKFSANEINNVWRLCSVSGRATAAILECFHAQTDKLAQAKDIERNNEHMEAITRQQVGVPAKPPE